MQHNSVELPFAHYIITYRISLKTQVFKMRSIKYQKFELDAEFCCIFLNVRDSPKRARINFGEPRAIGTVGEVRQSTNVAKILMFENSSKFEFSTFSDSVFRIWFPSTSSTRIHDVGTLPTKESNPKLETVEF